MHYLLDDVTAAGKQQARKQMQIVSFPPCIDSMLPLGFVFEARTVESLRVLWAQLVASTNAQAASGLL